MPETWTPEQILALAPDASSQKAGRDLASPRKWKTLGRSPDSGAAWGECQGSGKDPYQAQIELGEPAFRCSCPSRKFPCKHGLALFLLLAGSPSAFTETEPPAWVSEWLASRAKRAEQKAERATQKQEEGAAKVADPAAQAKTAARRQARVTAGLADAELWLHDLIRGGLAAAQGQPDSFWRGPARRMVDAQAPGVGRLIREMAGVSATGSGWQERLLEKLSRLHLLLEAYQRLESLPEETQADLRSLVGWTQSAEEVLEGPGVRDRWTVLGRRVEEPLDEDSRVRTQRTWLWGRETGRAALVLHFAPYGQPLDRSLPPGALIEAELAFYPGAYPLRALVKQRGETLPRAGEPAGHETILAATAAHAAALATNPWLELFPLPLRDVVPVSVEDAWSIRDREGRALPLAPQFDDGWRLLALSGGHPIALFAEWNGDSLLPLSAWAEGRFYPVLKTPE